MKDLFWHGKRVLLTGHTGFKGSWLALWLQLLGARVYGYALEPPTEINLFSLAGVEEGMADSLVGDICDSEELKGALLSAQPEVVFHLAAQPLVRYSYSDPTGTYATNVMGTVNLMESIRCCPSVKVFVNVTTDKCYENKELLRGYNEHDPMGGHDPYSSSKACSEMVTAAYRSSYFNPAEYQEHGVAVATARAGNVIGGGDWASDRLVPDIVRSILAGEVVSIRHPHAVRPWQHVLDPLSGYLVLAQKLYESGPEFSSAWNFGPEDKDSRSVEWIVRELCEKWNKGASYHVEEGHQPHETLFLKLDSSKARSLLGWKSRWDLPKALTSVVEWVDVYASQGDVRKCCQKQIEEYSQTGCEIKY